MHISYIHVYFRFVQVQCDFCRAYLQEREDVSSRNPTDLTQETLGWLKIISFIMNQHIYIHSHWYCFSYYITYIILILDKLLSIYLFVYIFVYIYIYHLRSSTYIALFVACTPWCWFIPTPHRGSPRCSLVGGRHLHRQLRHQEISAGRLGLSWRGSHSTGDMKKVNQEWETSWYQEIPGTQAPKVRSTKNESEQQKGSKTKLKS